MTQDPGWGWNYSEHPFDAWEASVFGQTLRGIIRDLAEEGTARVSSPPIGNPPLQIISGGLSPEVPEVPSLAKSLSGGGR